MESSGKAADIAGPNQEGSDDRSESPDGSDGQREQDGRHIECRADEGKGGVHDRSDERTDVGLVEVCTHACHIPDVVPDVVGNDRGVPWVVFGDSRLDLSNQVGADVGRLGVDTATDPGEEGDGGGPQRKSCDQIRPALMTEDVAEEDETEAHAEQSQPGDGEAHYRATTEGDRERFHHATGSGRLGGPRVGRGSDSHAGEPG